MKVLLALAALAAIVTSCTPNTHNATRPLLKSGMAKSYIPVCASHDNIWVGITDEEKTTIFQFLRRQTNATIPRDLVFDSDEQIWLLAPDKIEATDHLDHYGENPLRYARVLGHGKCVSIEYMFGPLPVQDCTKATPLQTFNDMCTESGKGPDEVSRRRRRDTISRQSKQKRSLHRRGAVMPYEEKMTWNGEELCHDDQSPPVTILPDGPRHAFDPEQNYVKWMDFTFYIATGPGGISLHDVRFRGDRIIYELAMQEALAHYAGPDKEQTNASYQDVVVGFDWFNLIPGIDCPAYATYTDAFCLFEFPKDYPMSRHFEERDLTFHATRNTAFMVRSISSVENYDYMTTYEFHLDGSIQVVVRASGYMQGSDNVNATNMHEYGFRIRDDLSGSMHDHVLNFKADLDILGTKNSLFKTEFVPHSEVYDWSDGKIINAMKVKRSFITNEDAGKINWGPNAAAAYSVVNKDKPNEFGEYPGFRIYPSIGSPIHSTIVNSTRFPGKLGWATHHLYALKRKDSEPVSSHPAPAANSQVFVNFDDFFNGESLDQEDIVLYFNLGMHHMPDTYDLPLVVFQGAQSGITFRPQNYLRSDASQSTRQQIHVTNDGGKQQVETYGSKRFSGLYNLRRANAAHHAYDLTKPKSAN